MLQKPVQMVNKTCSNLRCSPDDPNILSRRTITFLILMIFFMSIGEGAASPAIPLQGVALGASYRQLGFFMTGYSLAYTLMTVVAGAISDMIGRKHILLFSIGLSVIATLGYCYAASPVALLSFRTLEGASRGILWPIAEAIVADRTVISVRSKVMGRFTAAYGLGAVIGSLSGGYIMEHFHISAVFPLYPLIGLVVMATTLFGITDKPPVRRLPRISSELSTGVNITGEIKKIWPVCLAGFAYAGFLYSTLGLLPRIADYAGAQLQHIGYILAIFWAARLISFITCGEAAAVVDRKIVLLTGISFVILSTVIFFVAADFRVLMVAAAAGGIGSGIMFTINITLVADLINPDCLGFGMGFLEFCMGLGMIMQTTVSGVIGEAFGINFTFLCVFAVAVITFIMAIVYLQLPVDLQKNVGAEKAGS